MNSYINIKWTNETIRFKCAVETLVSQWEDFAYGYNIEEEALERICETLDELCIEYEILYDEEDEDL
jgi:hypothetical protein